MVRGHGAPETNDRRRQTSVSNRRDTVVIVAVLAVAAVGYFLFKGASPTSHSSGATGVSGQDTANIAAGIPDQIPKDYGSLVAMGNRLMDEGDLALAAELYRRALEINGESPDVRTDFGACLHGMGLAERAIVEFRKVIQKHPEHGVAHLNLGTVYYGLDQWDSARYYWEKCLSLEPHGRGAESARDYLKKLDN